MNALCFADISLPILQAFFKFIFILRIICSLKLFDNSTSPHSSTRFIAGHSPIAYFNAFFNIWPHPSDMDQACRTATFLLLTLCVLSRLILIVEHLIDYISVCRIETKESIQERRTSACQNASSLLDSHSIALWRCSPITLFGIFNP